MILHSISLVPFVTMGYSLEGIINMFNKLLSAHVKTRSVYLLGGWLEIPLGNALVLMSGVFLFFFVHPDDHAYSDHGVLFVMLFSLLWFINAISFALPIYVFQLIGNIIESKK